MIFSNCYLLFNLLMRTQQSKNKFREYSQKAISSRIDPQSVGMTRVYSSARKQRLMSQQIKNQYTHEVSTMNKINQNLEKSLKKKKKELQYVQSVRDRYISEIIRKQKLREQREIKLQKTRQKKREEALINKIRVQQAKQKLTQSKRKQKQEMKREFETLKSRRNLEQSLIWDQNHSRVKTIEEDKKRINDYCNQFYQRRSKKTMQSYKELISIEKKNAIRQTRETEKLEKKLLVMKERVKEKQKTLQELENSIETVRESRISIRQNRGLSAKSMTRFHPAHSTSKKINPETELI